MTDLITFMEENSQTKDAFKEICSEKGITALLTTLKLLTDKMGEIATLYSVVNRRPGTLAYNFDLNAIGVPYTLDVLGINLEQKTFTASAKISSICYDDDPSDYDHITLPFSALFEGEAEMRAELERREKERKDKEKAARKIRKAEERKRKIESEKKELADLQKKLARLEQLQKKYGVNS